MTAEDDGDDDLFFFPAPLSCAVSQQLPVVRADGEAKRLGDKLRIAETVMRKLYKRNMELERRLREVMHSRVCRTKSFAVLHKRL
jgi:predicted nuclease with RNAse H fold